MASSAPDDKSKPDPKHILPVPNATTPFWRTELHEIDSHRSTPELPRECDILIIGAGLSGVSTAYHLLHDNPNPPSIVLLEAREVCSGATGRNGGHLKMSYPNIASNIEKHGLAAARELAIFEAAQVHAIKAVVEKEHLDCEFVLRRTAEVVLGADKAEILKSDYEHFLAANLDFISDAQLLLPPTVSRLTSIHDAQAAITVTGASLWPYKFVTSLLATLLPKGLNLQTHTPVTSVFHSASHPTFHTVSTSRGAILARKVVFASNGYTAGILPSYAPAIVPVKITASHVVTTAPDGRVPFLSHTYGLSYKNGRRDYLVPRPDGSVIVGGAKVLTEKGKRESWCGNWDDSSVFGVGEDKYFADVMRTNFRGWGDSGARANMVWTGIIGRTPDSLPHIGRITLPNPLTDTNTNTTTTDPHTTTGPPRTYILAGFNGAGMAYIFLSALGLSKLVLDDDLPFAKSGIPRVFETGKERLESATRAWKEEGEEKEKAGHEAGLARLGTCPEWLVGN